MLGVIAAHDRFGRNGLGCTASQSRLAELVGCRREAINAAIRLLELHGYIECGIDTKTERRFSYSVVYDNEADNAAFAEGRTQRRGPKHVSKARAPQRTSPAHKQTGKVCASERTSKAARRAPQRTSQSTANRAESAENSGFSEAPQEAQYIPRSGNISVETGFATIEPGSIVGAEHRPPPPGPLPDPEAIRQQLEQRQAAFAKTGWKRADLTGGVFR
ncbi:MAG: hypothetical protein AB7L90_10285 [Hyphomicrobiaceae bacterium]